MDQTQDLAGEGLLAVVGLGAFLDGRPVTPTAQHLEDAAALAFRWRRRVRRWLRSEAPETPRRRAPEVATLRRAIEVLTDGDPMARYEEQTAGLDDDAADAVMPALVTVVQAAEAALPMRPARQTAMGPVLGEPSDLEMARWRLTWGVLDDPSQVLDDLEAGQLVGRQVRALATGYPGLYNLLMDLVAKELGDLGTDHPRAQLPRAKDLQLRVLMQAPMGDMAKATAMQGNFAAPEPMDKPPMPSMPRKSDDVSSPIQRVADR